MADMRSTGMLTNPNVIVPDQIDRTGAPAASCDSGAPPSCLRLGNLLLPSGCDARSQALRETYCRRLLPAADGLDLFAACLGLDQLAQPLPIFVRPRRRIEIRFDRRHELL